MKPYNDSVAVVLSLARNEARAGRASQVKPEHLLLGLAQLCREDLGEKLEASRLDPVRRVLIEANATFVRRRFGHDREGQLSGPLRDHPHSVVLFDEVEKAYPEILDILLQIFDEGRLTDSRGRHVSFTESVVILTSNLGTRQAAEPAKSPPLGFAPPGPPDGPAAAGQSAAAERIRAALTEGLRPELLGRIGHVVVFEPLDEAALRRILDKLLDRVRARLKDRSITIAPTEAAYELLLARTAGARSGTRALEQAVEQVLVQPLGRALLAELFADGTAVVIDAVDGALAFSGSAPPMEGQDTAP
ncbi:AAA family ATPase [Streptomyces sp. NPDC003038]|uniref:AAA family ATPase n=1 Tax=unclassified Streptomyces TaxID=2593676 RepID=UPI0033A969DA